ncbi:metallophosphoesterase [Sporosarcina luteola]|uniref:metallophosphoesterase n=1 Tax=Sporosarcina luteola TaxID=582850 RepID=UPI00203DBF0B|nr:metallophosphoesterase [Sporosarcina luteola]MCM3743532.1 metallophosphoesterase [Sporosarcina luteola]
MRIIAMSDSHGDKETVKTVSALQADAVFHCGDSELSWDEPLVHTIHIVKGNCDRDLRFPDSVIVEVGGKKIWMVHGHEHDVKRTMLPLYYGAQELGADIVLFGHSHSYAAELREGILFVNPGSTLLPRAGKQPTFAEIEWDDGYRIYFKNMDMDTIITADMKNIAN